MLYEETFKAHQKGWALLLLSALLGLQSRQPCPFSSFRLSVIFWQEDWSE